MSEHKFFPADMPKEKRKKLIINLVIKSVIALAVLAVAIFYMFFR